MLLFFLGLAAVATRPLWRDLAGQMPVGPDPVIDLWTLDWLTGHALEPGQLFHGNVFHPFPYAALHSDLSLGTALLALPLRPFLGDPVPLYNAGLLLALAFGGWAFCRLVDELTGRLSAGLLAGVLAAFGSHQLYHVYHLNLLSTGWLALLLLALHRLAERPGPAWALLAGVSFALSALSSGYYAVAGVLLALAAAAARARRLLAGRALAWSAAAAKRQQAIESRVASGKFTADDAKAANAWFMSLERALLAEEGLPDRFWFRHLVYAPLPSYAAETLPGIREAVLASRDPRPQIALLTGKLRTATAAANAK